MIRCNKNLNLKFLLSAKFPRTKFGNIIAFIFGVIVGVSISMLCFSDRWSVPPLIDFQSFEFFRHADSRNATLVQPVVNSSRVVQNDTTPVHQKLEKEVRVLCWIMTQPENHHTKAIYVKNTWGKRCTKLLFMSTAEDDILGTIALPTYEGRGYLWEKTRLAFQYIYKHHFDDADWFMKADDDTYVILENLRYMLYPYFPEEPVFFGCTFLKSPENVVFASGGPGYVLSKEAVRRFVLDAIPDETKCDRSTGKNHPEDLEIAKCLKNVNVGIGDSRDSQGGLRFFHIDPQINLMQKPNLKNFWYWNYEVFQKELGPNCCSDTPVSFHYISPEQMYDMEYFIYRVRPYGIEHKTDKLAEKIEYVRISQNNSVEQNTLNITQEMNTVLTPVV